MNNVKNRLRNIEKAVAPRLMEVPQFHCLIDGKEEIMSAVEFAFATVEEGRNGEMLREAPSIFQPVKTHLDYTSLKATQAEIKKRMESEPL